MYVCSGFFIFTRGIHTEDAGKIRRDSTQLQRWTAKLVALFSAALILIET